jgi:hypothetical protein
MATSTEAKERAWDLLIQPLGLAKASVGARVTAPADAPELSGVVEVVNPPATAEPKYITNTFG